MVAGVAFIQLQMREVGYACLLCHSLPYSLETEPGARVVANPPASDWYCGYQDAQGHAQLLCRCSGFELKSSGLYTKHA